MLTSIQKESIGFECFINRLFYLSKGPFGIHGKTKVYFIKIIKANTAGEEALQN